MKLPFMIIKRSTWLDKHQYRIKLENEVARLTGELASKNRILNAVTEAAPIVREDAIKEGVTIGRTAMKRDLLRHARRKVIQ